MPHRSALAAWGSTLFLLIFLSSVTPSDKAPHSSPCAVGETFLAPAARHLYHICTAGPARLKPRPKSSSTRPAPSPTAPCDKVIAGRLVSNRHPEPKLGHPSAKNAVDEEAHAEAKDTHFFRLLDMPQSQSQVRPGQANVPQLRSPQALLSGLRGNFTLVASMAANFGGRRCSLPRTQ